jgi:hypothetical protein
MQHPRYCIPGTNALGFIDMHRSVSLGTACREVRKFVAWLDQDHHSSALYRCTAGVPGTPILVMHSLDGYRLSVGEGGGGLVLAKGRSSFEIAGFSGWPVGCD